MKNLLKDTHIKPNILSITPRNAKVKSFLHFFCGRALGILLARRGECNYRTNLFGIIIAVVVQESYQRFGMVLALPQRASEDSVRNFGELLGKTRGMVDLVNNGLRYI